MIFVTALFIGFFFIKNTFFLNYARVATWLGGVYLFLQMVSIIDAMYLWAEYWAKKFSDGNTCYGCLLIFAAVGMYTATGFIVFNSFRFFWIAGCGLNKFMLILLCLFLVAFPVLILLKFHPKGSLIT